MTAARSATLTPEMRFLQGAQREATAGFRRRLAAIIGFTVLLAVLVPFWIYVVTDSLFGPDTDADTWRRELGAQYGEIGAQFRPEWVSPFSYTGLAAMATVNVALVVRSVQLARSDVYEWGVWRGGVQQFLGFVAAMSTTVATVQWYGLDPEARGRAVLVVLAAFATAVLAAWVPSDTNLIRHNQLTELRGKRMLLDATTNQWATRLTGFDRWRSAPAQPRSARIWQAQPRLWSSVVLLVVAAVLIAAVIFFGGSLIAITWEIDAGPFRRWSLAVGVVVTSGLLVVCVLWAIVTRGLAETALSPSPGVASVVVTVELLVSFCWAALTASALAAASRITSPGVLVAVLVVAALAVVVLSRLLWHSARSGLPAAGRRAGLRPYVWGWAWTRATAVLAGQRINLDDRIELLEARTADASSLDPPHSSA